MAILSVRRSAAAVAIAALVASMVPVLAPAIGEVPLIPTAEATESCSSATQGDRDTVIHADNTSTTANGFNCGYVYTTGNKSISMWEVDTVSHTTGFGYQKVYDCALESDNKYVSIVGPTVIDGLGTLPSTATWTASNAADGTRHFTVAALWNTTVHSRYPLASQYIKDCADYTIPANTLHPMSVTWDVFAVGDGTMPAQGTTVTVTMKSTDGYSYTDTAKTNPVAVMIAGNDTTTCPNKYGTNVVGAGYFVDNVATFTIGCALSSAQPVTVDVYPVFKGMDYLNTTPPATGPTGFDGSCLGLNCADGDIIKTITFNPTAGQPITTGFTVANASSAATSQKLRGTVTVSVASNSAQVPNQSVYIKQMAGTSPSPKTDTTVGAAVFSSLGQFSQGAGSAMLNYSQDVYFTAPATAGSYAYYSYYPQSSTSPTYNNGFAMSMTSPVKVTVLGTSDSCSAKYGAPDNTYIKANNSATDDTGYNCAYVEQKYGSVPSRVTGQLKMNPPWPYIPLKTISGGTNNSGTDPWCWTPKPQSDINVMYANVMKGSSASSPSNANFQMYNSTTATKNYSASVLWMAAEHSSTPYTGQYKVCGGVSNDKAIVNAQLVYKVTASLSANGAVSAGTPSDWTVVTAPRYSTDTVSVASAAVNVRQMLGSAPAATDPVVGSGTVVSDRATVSVTPQSGAMAFYADVDGSNYVTPTLPSRGWTAARSTIVDFGGGSAAMTRIAVSKPEPQQVEPSGALKKLLGALTPAQVWDVEAAGSNGRKVTAMCPKGYSIQSMATLGEQTYLPHDFMPEGDGAGITLVTRGKDVTRLHLDCRANTEKAVVAGKIGRGSIRGDDMATVTDGSVITGGLGDDTLTTTHSMSALFGGFGDDRLRLRADETAASGGPGDDVLSATGSSGLLNGGGGRDTFSTGSGEIRVNARDGRPGDVVTCGSPATRVLADKGDILKGPCAVVKYDSSREDGSQAPTVTSGTPDILGTIATGNGTSGYDQVVSVVAPSLRGTTVALNATNGSLSSPLEVTLNDKGQGSVPWMPTGAGTWSIAPTDTAVGLTPATPVIGAVPTVTSLYVPDKATRFEPTLLAATVDTAGGDQPVTGTVSFYEVYRGKVGEQEVTALPGGRALASIQWTPPGEGTYAFYSKFTPEVDSGAGTAPLQASDSNTSYLNVRTGPSVVQLLMPPVMRVGKPVLVMASLPQIFGGTVSLMIDGREVSPPKETVNGFTAFPWTPTHQGLTYVTLELISDRFPRLDREVTQTIDVQAPLPPNPISVTPVVDGVAGQPWAEDDVLTYPGGTRIDLVASTGNGAGVNIAQRGPCLLNGSRIVVPKAGGGCRVTFSAPGDARYADNSAELLITASATAEGAQASE